MRFLLLLIAILLSNLVSTQTVSNQLDSTTNREWIFKTVIKDQAEIWSSPFRMQKTQLKTVLPILAITGFSIIYDEEIYKGFKNFQKRNSFVDDVSPVITYMGDDKTIQGVSTLFLAGGVIFKNKKAKQTALMGYQTFVHCGIVIQVFKHLASRQRPSYGKGKDKWNGPGAMFKRYSENYSPYDAFPSGHTIMAWGLATILAEQYKNYKWVPITSYTLATMAGLSRITEDTHWLSDVIVGGAMGYGIARYISRTHQDTNWKLFPSFRRNNDVSLTALYTF